MHAAWLLGAAALLTAGVLLGWADPLDTAVGPTLAAGGEAWALVTRLGDTVVLLGASLAAAGLLWFLRGRVEGAVMASLAVAQWVVIWTLKLLIGRNRPDSIVDPASPAFPSGHALGSTAVYVGMAVLAAPRHAGAIVLGAAIALLVGWSRLALGVHHLTDVLAGWLIGAALVMLAHDLRSSIRARQGAAPPPAPPPRPPRRPGAP